MIITKCDRCRRIMETPAYAQAMFPLIFQNMNRPQFVPKYIIIRCEPNNGQDSVNLCPECERELDIFLRDHDDLPEN